MQINLANGFYIDVDPLNYTLKEKYIGESKKTGEKVPGERVHGYFSTLDKAVEKFLFLNQLSCEPHMSMEMRQYVDFVMNANTQAVRAIKSVVGVVERK